VKPRRITGWTALSDSAIGIYVIPKRHAAAYFADELDREGWSLYRITLVRQPKRRAKRGKKL
jgi:hypothetical protein